MNSIQNLSKWTLVVCIAMFAGVAAANCGQCGADGEKHDHEHPEKAKKAKAKKGIPVNGTAPAFALTDINGKTVKLSQFEDKIVVLEWTNYGCPFVKAHYASEKKTTSKLAEKYKDKDVVWLVINSTHTTTAEKNKEWAKKVSLKQTVLLDTDGKVGKLFYAKTTPHLFVINKEGKIAYQGAMDNAPLGKTKEGEEFVNYVDQALTELLAGEKVSVPKTKPYGCSVKYPPKDKK